MVIICSFLCASVISETGIQKNREVTVAKEYYCIGFLPCPFTGYLHTNTNLRSRFFLTGLYLSGAGCQYRSVQALRPSEIIALYPMGEDAEAAIVHEIPGRPVTIDGTLYESKGVSAFNGKRLHFTVGKAGNLYAFTKAEAMEEFIEAEYGKVFDSDIDILSARGESQVFSDWLYGGREWGFPSGEQIPELAPIGWDDCISSAIISEDGPVTLWDDAWYGGDSFTMLPGSNHSILALEGWNDRASSIS